MHKALGTKCQFTVISEQKPEALEFIVNNHLGNKSCNNVILFTSLQDHINGGGYCHIRKKEIIIAEQPDILCLSPSCQPFSPSRSRSGSTRKTGRDEDHPLWEVPQELAVQLVLARQPKVFILEEIMGWMKRKPGQDKSPAEQFAGKLIRRYPGIGTYCLDQADWSEGSRPRCLLKRFETLKSP